MSNDPLLHFGPYRLDVGNEQLWRNSQLVRLTPKASQVLRVLVNSPGQLVTKEELFRGVWPETVVSDAALTSCIQELRQALGDNARTPRYIETAHRRGFRFLAAVTAGPVSSSEFRVPSQEEENQKPVLSIVEGANGSSSLESRVQSLESNEHGVESGIQEQHSEPASDPQPLLPSSQPLASTRFWSSKSLMVTSLLLLIGTVITVQYLSLPLPSTQPLTSTPQFLPLPDKPSIIVLPFVNLSSDPAQEYFSDGITEEITATLSRVSGLFVIARTSAFTYKGKAVKVQDISREMGVHYVLEGSVQKADGQVRIIAQLIDATTGKHLWSQHYDQPLQNIFALQDEIRQQITLALQVRLAPEESGQGQRAPTRG